MKKLTVKALLMAGIIAFSANVFADPVTTPSEEKEIELGNASPTSPLRCLPPQWQET